MLLFDGSFGWMRLDVSECRRGRVGTAGNEVRAALQMLMLSECLDVVWKK